MTMEEKYREITSKLRQQGKEKFFPWFIGFRDLNATFEHGVKIFDGCILPTARKYLGDLSDKSLLEIGYGGGILLAPAARQFKSVSGIDIHKENNFVQDELKSRGVEVDRLYITPGSTLPYNRKFDFVFCFTVFGHLSGYDVFRKYIKALPKSLTENGVAMIHFNRLICRKKGQTPKEIEEDFRKEETMGGDGWRYRDLRPNQITLMIAMWKVQEECAAAGLKVLESGPSGYPDPVKGMLYGGQAYVVVGLPDEKEDFN